VALPLLTNVETTIELYTIPNTIKRYTGEYGLNTIYSIVYSVHIHLHYSRETKLVSRSIPPPPQIICKGFNLGLLAPFNGRGPPQREHHIFQNILVYSI